MAIGKPVNTKASTTMVQVGHIGMAGSHNPAVQAFLQASFTTEALGLSLPVMSMNTFAPAAQTTVDARGPQTLDQGRSA